MVINKEILTKLEQYLIDIDKSYNYLIEIINTKTQSIYNLVDT